ncbi:hypothetical protein FOZ62_017483, partial [Perkinsus olseni]
SSRIVMDPTPQQLKDGILHMVEYALNDSLSLLKPAGQDMMNNNNEVLHSNSGDGHDNILHNNNTDDDDIVMGIRRRTKEITMEALDSSLKMPLQVLTWYNVYLPLLGIDDDYDGITLTSTDKDDEHIINTINTAKQHQHQLKTTTCSSSSSSTTTPGHQADNTTLVDQQRRGTRRGSLGEKARKQSMMKNHHRAT